MTSEISDFIGVFHKAFSKEFCEQCINVFNTAEKYGFVLTRQQHTGVKKTLKDTDSFFINADVSYEFLTTSPMTPEFSRIFWNNVYPEYTAKYSILDEMDPHTFYSLKMQRTRIGGGYHVWHQEVSEKSSHRIMNFMLYLNDVHEGGETEFLYYPRRIKPEMGKVVIYPAGYTHTHRGNPPLSNEKYVINGWLEF